MTWAVRPAVPVAGAPFPVRRIYAIGRHCAGHAAETGLDAGGAAPGMSLKPADSVVPGDSNLPCPPATPEIELVIGKGGANVPRAIGHVHAVGFDLRDANRRNLCKSFDCASPASAVRPAFGHPSRGEIAMTVNGRQRGDLSQWGPAEIVSRLSACSRLEPGNIVFTGTPKGPAPVARGDLLEGRSEGVGRLRIV